MAASQRLQIFCHSKMIHLLSLSPYRSKIYLVCESLPATAILLLLRSKKNPELETDGHYLRLNVEGYGGMLCAPWLDRPLSVAGRVIIKDHLGRLCSRLINIDRDLLLIPSLAIHMNREANSGYKYNIQKDMLPLYGSIASKGTFMKMLAEAADAKETAILGHDLFSL